jgi:hypothetical protein
MENENTMMTSDFPHSVRETIEKKLGGVAVYVSGDIGAAEIIGDTNNQGGDRATFDGKDFPLVKGNRPVFTFERTEAIGRDVARAALDAINRGEWSEVASIEVKKARLSVPMDNRGYMFLMSRGVLDTGPRPSEGQPFMVETWVYAITLGEAQMISTPGELFPEVFYGVEKYRRRDCPQADTGRPMEPGVRDRMKKKYRFVLGLCPDELGYIVPGYDFLAPSFGLSGLQEAKDPCKSKGVTDHYHETNSASSQLAPAWACIAAQLLDGSMPDAQACRGMK